MTVIGIVFVFIALISCLQTGQNLAIHIETIPQTYNRITDNAVHFSCTPDDKDKAAEKILLMELYKDATPFVVLHPGKQPTVADQNDTRLVAGGHIDVNVSESSLTLTIANPQSYDFGLYTCIMYVLDKINVLMEQKASMNFTEEKLNVKTLEDVLRNLKNKIASIEEKTTRDLDKKTRQINDLTNKVGHSVAFSATNKNNMAITKGKVLIFPDIIMQVGQGYDTTTGKFSAPTHGIYVFHLVVTEYRHCFLDLDLMANDKLLARLYTYDRTNWSQSSVNAVTELNSGDRVFSISRDNGCNLVGQQYSVFTGYLVQPL